MAKRGFNEHDHEKAYLVWKEKRAFTAVAEELGCAYSTPFAWSLSTCHCKWGCPWHGWEDLLKAEQRAITAKIDLMNHGNYNPVHHEIAMKQAIEDANAPRKVQALTQIITGDIERIAQLELLYKKVYFGITGIAIDHAQLAIDNNRLGPQLDIQAVYRQGLQTLSIDAGIKQLQVLMGEIDKLKFRLPKEDTQPERTIDMKKSDSLSPDEMRAMLHALPNVAKQLPEPQVNDNASTA